MAMSPSCGAKLLVGKGSELCPAAELLDEGSVTIEDAVVAVLCTVDVEIAICGVTAGGGEVVVCACARAATDIWQRHTPLQPLSSLLE